MDKLMSQLGASLPIMIAIGGSVLFLLAWHLLVEFLAKVCELMGGLWK